MHFIFGIVQVPGCPDLGERLYVLNIYYFDCRTARLVVASTVDRTVTKRKERRKEEEEEEEEEGREKERKGRREED